MTIRNKTKTKAKKRNPQDATMRNIRALKKRVDELEVTVKALVTRVKFIIGD